MKDTRAMLKTAFIYDPLFLNHNTGSRHPERSERLKSAHGLLSSQEWYPSLDHLQPRPAAHKWVSTIHDPHYIDRVRQSCEAGERHIDSPDVSVSTASYEVALNAAGAMLELADRVMCGDADNGFAMVRPPGHHAESAEAMGFCLFNNIAITARYLQQKHNLERILILDWDVHHGNGTQHSFEQDPSVFYISLHQYPHYPGTGALSETGIGKGEGTTLNCPMSPGLGEFAYREAMTEIVLPAARAFNPDAVLVSAGFDAHHADPLGDINLEKSSYTWMTQQVMELADQCCEGRLISLLEGGYDLDALAQSVTEHVRVLSQS
jgi:acetoin utilization deacetylase AcuC-like enzyme